MAENAGIGKVLTTEALPHGLTLLCVSSTQPSWTSLALQLDAVGCADPTLRWASTVREALSLLREEQFDGLIVAEESSRSAQTVGKTRQRAANSRTAEQLDAFECLRALRATGYEEAVVLLTAGLDDARWQESVELDCFVLVTDRLWESRALVPALRREILRAEQKRDNRRLSMAQHRRLLRERDETEHLLQQQRQILEELQELVSEQQTVLPAVPCEPSPVTEIPSPPDVLSAETLNHFYDELLRTYVLMGSGRLAGEIGQVAELLFTAGVSLRQALGLHLRRVEKLVNGLGRRSSRHVMTRADLLALELVIQLGECYIRGEGSGADSQSVTTKD